jgi:hypothetical protein
MDPDPDPGGPKTRGSGFATLLFAIPFAVSGLRVTFYRILPIRGMFGILSTRRACCLRTDSESVERHALMNKYSYCSTSETSTGYLVAFIAVLWIRIRIGSGFNGVPGIAIRIQEGKIDPQTQKKVNKFNFLKGWMFSFEG